MKNAMLRAPKRQQGRKHKKNSLPPDKRTFHFLSGVKSGYIVPIDEAQEGVALMSLASEVDVPSASGRLREKKRHHAMNVKIEPYSREAREKGRQSSEPH